MSAVGALPVMEVGRRLDRLRARFDDAEIDSLLVSHLVNVRYLTGFTGSAGALLVSPDEALFVTDGRYGEQAADQLARSGVEAAIEVTGTRQQEVLADAVADGTRLGLESEHVSWSQQRRYAEGFEDATVVATEGVVEGLRVVKDEGEIARMEAAATVADDALGALRSRLGGGVTEREFGLELDTEMRRRGASGPSFDTIVASGPNGAMPHARPGDRRIGSGDLVVIDFGAVVDGYCSDMTRTFSVGEPSGERSRMLQVVGESQAAGVAAVEPGVTCRDVDAACRDVIGDAGWGEAFLHSTGHGVGLDIHENPRVTSRSTTVLEEGMVVTVEPGVYLPEVGGVRVEDTVVVTAGGSRALTRAPKDVVV